MNENEVINNDAIALDNVDEKIVEVDFQKSHAAKAYNEVQNFTTDDAPEMAAIPPLANTPNYKEIAQRTAAEFDNYRKRVARERTDWQRDILARFLQDFLPAFDDLDRTIAESEKNSTVETICTGVKLARENLWKTLEKAGVQEIKAAQQKFDPRYHEALSILPMPDKEPNTIIEVFQPGYSINDFVLRPARVVVAGEQP